MEKMNDLVELRSIQRDAINHMGSCFDSGDMAHASATRILNRLANMATIKQGSTVNVPEPAMEWAKSTVNDLAIEDNLDSICGDDVAAKWIVSLRDSSNEFSCKVCDDTGYKKPFYYGSPPCDCLPWAVKIRTCKTCGKPENPHNFRHPFIPDEPEPRETESDLEAKAVIERRKEAAKEIEKLEALGDNLCDALDECEGWTQGQAKACDEWKRR